MLNIKAFILTVLIGYAIILILIYLFQEKMIFYPGKLPQDYKYNLSNIDQEVFIKCTDGVEISGVLYDNNGSKVILYFHGNAGDLSTWQYVSGDFKRMGVDLLIVDYRGYGKSSGNLSESGLYQDALSSYNFLKDHGYASKDIIIYGRSLGTGVASKLAAQRDHAALILETPYLSFVKLANEKMPFVFPGLLLRYRFDNISNLKSVQSPTLFIHGDRDELIPESHSRRLFKAANELKDLLIIENGHHNDLSTFPIFEEKLRSFIINL